MSPFTQHRATPCRAARVGCPVRLATHGVRLAAAFAFAIGGNAPAWSEVVSSPAQPDSAIQFIAASDRAEHSLVTKTREEAPRVASKPAPAPASAAPLSIADYQNYIGSGWMGALASSPPAAQATSPAFAAEPAATPTLDTAAAKPVSGQPIAGPAFTNETARPVVKIQVATPAVSAANRAATPVAPEATPITQTAMDRSQLRVAKVTPANASPGLEGYEPAAVLAQQDMPKPAPPSADVTNETVAASAEQIPPATVGPPSAAMTSPNFLPANPENYCFRCGVKCPPGGCNPGGPGWGATRPIPWEIFAQGEYVGPARLAHVPVYRLRVDDRLSFVYRLSGQVSGQPYRLNVRDRVLIQSLSAPEVVNREVIIEPDGTITLPLLGQVRAAGATIDELSHLLDDQFKRQIKDPRITVTPLVMNSNLEELRSSVDRRYGQGGQVSDARVSPDGTIQLPAIGLVPAQGLTIDELEREIKARYAQIVAGLEVTPILMDRAPRYIFVVGEVGLPGRYAMEGPTTLMMAITQAGSWNVGAQLNNVVVFRRDENWQLMATRVNIRESLLFKKPCPTGEIWLRDSDIVLVPKSPILCADDAISLIFTRGIYGVFPMNATLNFAKLSSL